MPFAELPSKPGAPLAYDIIGNITTSNLLIVVINGLGLPAASWQPTASLLQGSQLPFQLSMLLYDRYGQGATTARDPLDQTAGREEGYGHDLNDAVTDLHELLGMFAVATGVPRRIVFVSASVGVHIARLFAGKYPDVVTAHVFLDSNIGNVEYTDMIPDPRSSNFHESEVVAEDCTIEQFKDVVVKVGKMFNSDVKNPEGLDRRNVKNLLPDPSQPKLRGPGGETSWLVVVGHDPVQFEEENTGMMGTPRSLTRKFFQP